MVIYISHEGRDFVLNCYPGVFYAKSNSAYVNRKVANGLKSAKRLRLPRTMTCAKMKSEVVY